MLKKNFCNFFAKLKKLLSKPTKTLENIEEGFQFPFSHVLFQIVSFVGVLAILVGICVFLYSVSPVFERSVSEPELLSQREITADEVLECAKPVPMMAKTRSVSNSRKDEPASETNAEPQACEMPKISFEKLAAALPNVQFSKKGGKIFVNTAKVTTNMETGATGCILPGAMNTGILIPGLPRICGKCCNGGFLATVLSSRDL